MTIRDCLTTLSVIHTVIFLATCLAVLVATNVLTFPKQIVLYECYLTIGNVSFSMIAGGERNIILQTVATKVAGQMLHGGMLEKFLATLRELLRKVELDSTFRKGYCNHGLFRNVFGRCKVCHIGQCSVQLVSLWRCETCLMKKCIVYN